MSDIRANTISDASGNGPINLHKQSAAKAWVNFNGTGTVAIRNSQGVSGLVDNSKGNYDVNYTSNMSASDYSVTTAVGQISPFPIAQAYLASVSVGFVRLNTAQPSDYDYDLRLIVSTTHGDLA